MEISINSLLERVDDFLFERASRGYRAVAGLEKGLPAVQLHADFSEVSSADVLASVRERLENPRADETRRARLRLLATFLVSTGLDARTAAQRDAIATVLTQTRFPALGRQLSMAEALREQVRHGSREGRELIERELELRFAEHASPFLDLAEAVVHAPGPLGHSSALSLVEAVHGRPFARGLAHAAEFLDVTGDAYADLLRFALRRSDSSLKPQLARLHDAERAAQAPWLAELLRKEDLEHAVIRCLGDLGLPPNANGRIAADTEARPGRLSGAHVFSLRVPDQVRLVLTAESGLETWASWLSTWGVAQHQANVSRTAPLVERALGDRALPAAVGVLFESFLLDEGWLKRYVRLTSPQAREVSRLFAFRQVLQARRECAVLSIVHDLLQRGPSSGFADQYVQRLSDALGVHVPPHRWVVDVDPLAPGLVSLDARALEGRWHEALRERFNEDYWRNPATGRWLLDLAAKGQRDDTQTVATQLAPEGLSVGPAARRRVAVMGA